METFSTIYYSADNSVKKIADLSISDTVIMTTKGRYSTESIYYPASVYAMEKRFATLMYNELGKKKSVSVEVNTPVLFMDDSVKEKIRAQEKKDTLYEFSIAAQGLQKMFDIENKEDVAFFQSVIDFHQKKLGKAVGNEYIDDSVNSDIVVSANPHMM